MWLVFLWRLARAPLREGSVATLPRSNARFSPRWTQRASLPQVSRQARRRPHVVPHPHPSSCGSIRQGMPLRRTETMPVRQARSETRGRPPGVGRNAGFTEKNLRAWRRPLAFQATRAKLRFFASAMRNTSVTPRPHNLLVANHLGPSRDILLAVSRGRSHQLLRTSTVPS
jgi:hypothetical protein